MSRSEANVSPPVLSARDQRLDVLRGLCLLNMVVVHLVEQGLAMPAGLNETVMHWFRFAAGGFVLTSGLCVGAIFFPRIHNPTKRWSAHGSLLKRAGLILLVHYFATFLSLSLVPMQGYREYETRVWVGDVLRLWTGYDLLIFYFAMVLLSPLILEAVRRLGAWPVIGASVALFFYRYDNPYLGLYGIENHFPLLRWQLIYVAGLVIGTRLPAFDAWRRSRKAIAMLSLATIALAVAGASAVERWSGVSGPWYTQVTKMPLSPLEVVRYLSLTLAIAICLDLAWRKFERTHAASILALMGGQSLLLWVAHVPIVAHLTAVPWSLAILVAVGLCWLTARGATAFARFWDARSPAGIPPVRYAAPALGSLLLVAVLAHYQQPTQIADIGDDMTEPAEVFETLPGFDEEPLSPIPVDDDSIMELT